MLSRIHNRPLRSLPAGRFYMLAWSLSARAHRCINFLKRFCLPDDIYLHNMTEKKKRRCEGRIINFLRSCEAPMSALLRRSIRRRFSVVMMTWSSSCCGRDIAWRICGEECSQEIWPLSVCMHRLNGGSVSTGIICSNFVLQALNDIAHSFNNVSRKVIFIAVCVCEWLLLFNRSFLFCHFMLLRTMQSK